MNQLYLALGLVAAIGLAWWRYDYVVTDRDAEKLRADNAVATIALRDKSLETERKNAADAANRATERQTEKEVLQREYDEKLKCISDGNCVVRMRWGSASCPTASVRSPNTGPSGSDDIQAQDQRNLSEWVANVEHAADLDALTIEGLKKELEVRTAKDACVAK